MAAGPEPFPRLDALGPRGAYRGRAVEPVSDVAGARMAELSLVPQLFVQRSMSALRAAEAMSADALDDALSSAGELFATGTLTGMSTADYQLAVSRVSGMPISSVQDTTRMIADHARVAFRSAWDARPSGALQDWRAVGPDGGGVWCRRGEVFAVHAPANTPAVHVAWLEALALGYRVAVRPSRREPFTPHRLITALREAGFGADHLVLLPTDHAIADSVIEGADLAMAFGGDDVVAKYGASTRLMPQGPGRSKVLLTAGSDLDRYLDRVVESVARHAGTGCVNATAVFVEGDPSPVAEALAERLAPLPALPPEDEKAVLPVKPVAVAQAIDEYLHGQAGEARALLGGDTVVRELGDGSAALTPAVFQLDRADAPQAGVELGFPCVWVLPWSREDALAPFKDTLVFNVIPADDADPLVPRLIAEPSIRNVHIGGHATTWARPGIPHDGYIGEFLMRTKAVVR